MNNIQKRLKETRKQKGFTQKKIADLLGVTQQTYQQIEAGSTQDMRVSTLIKLCELLEISSDWLLDIKKPILITEFDPSFEKIMTEHRDVIVKGTILRKKIAEESISQPKVATTED